ncbi:spermatogenesis-associated protein 4 isoform X1 [Alosa sapidissima]|uniref:spermatogenesis-associated protein 4 isoform X1 n=1 Tax=Alosa sapidissima TaxID=34773 RepID=UPI001C08CB41|nr:spermatogenesis-associated protein 4 isoform X1 [Alosa sapidissima]
MAYAQTPKKTGLPREVLKWLQSLDLSFSPKNVRRDFSNGYLVAEIFSWYYPEDFTMHSYDNGTSLAAKLSNWAQIERFFTRQHIPLPKEVIDGTIHCKPGAAELLVQEIYSILTHRRLKTWLGGDVDFSDRGYQVQLPMVARSTASKAIKNNLRQSEMVAEPNINTIQGKIQAIVQRHLEDRRLERLQDPKRFGVKPTLGERAACLSTSSSRSTQGPDSPFISQPDSRGSLIRSRTSVHFKEMDRTLSY